LHSFGKLVRSALGWLPVTVEVFSPLLKSRAALPLEKIAVGHQNAVSRS
jgi:hypothetical protein